MQTIAMKPIGAVRSKVGSRKADLWGDSESTSELDPAAFTTEALAGRSEFSHVEVLFHFHNLPEESIVTSKRHPRENPRWPRVANFAQRGKSASQLDGCNHLPFARCRRPAGASFRP